MAATNRRRRRIIPPAVSLADPVSEPATPTAAARAAAAEAHHPSPADLAGLGMPFAWTSGVHDHEVATAARDDAVADDPHAERGLRGLVGGGSTQVNVSAAMRARDAARPTEADIEAAEAELVIIRRGWTPREELPHSDPPRRPRLS